MNHKLSAHEVACYWKNYPNRAAWYLNNGKSLTDVYNAQHSFDLVTGRL